LENISDVCGVLKIMFVITAERKEGSGFGTGSEKSGYIYRIYLG
jgi:hypothetical protein